MRLCQGLILMGFVLGNALDELQATTCEETETELAKLDTIKECINKSKSFYPECRDEDEAKTECGKKAKAFAQLNIALNLLEQTKGKKELWPECPEPIINEVIYDTCGDKPVDCSELKRMGYNKSGVYEIWPRRRDNVNMSMSVYCDMDTDRGGWTVIQRRNNYKDQTNFYQDWAHYKKGFGILEKDFWLGNDNIYTLTNQGVYSIRFDLVNHEGEKRYAVYEFFYIGDEESNYLLHVHKFSRGTLSNDFQQHSEMMFSTKDRQNDRRDRNNACAFNYRGGWWYHGTCGHVNLNGMYLPGVNDVKSMFWFDWKRTYGLQFSEMKIRHRYPNLNVPKLNAV